jgi:hypothetical protein
MSRPTRHTAATDTGDESTADSSSRALISDTSEDDTESEYLPDFSLQFLGEEDEDEDDYGMTSTVVSVSDDVQDIGSETLLIMSNIS